jgi:hypothetical protein
MGALQISTKRETISRSIVEAAIESAIEKAKTRPAYDAELHKLARLKTLREEKQRALQVIYETKVAAGVEDSDIEAILAGVAASPVSRSEEADKLHAEIVRIDSAIKHQQPAIARAKSAYCREVAAALRPLHERMTQRYAAAMRETAMAIELDRVLFELLAERSIATYSEITSRIFPGERLGVETDRHSPLGCWLAEARHDGYEV